MDDNKKKYPGFIDGLKASNISLNRTSLNEYSEQILSKILFLSKKDDLSLILKDHLKRSEQTIKDTLHNEPPNEIINLYIKFGDIFYSILPQLKLKVDKKEFKDIAINYLQIAKFSSDSRIKDLSISIAKEFDS